MDIATSVYLSGEFIIVKEQRKIATIFVLDNTSATKGCKNAVNLLNEMEESNILGKNTFSSNKTYSIYERYCSRLS